MRMRLLNVSQGKRNVHAYVEGVRYLVVSITKPPIGMSPPITLFLNSLRGSQARNHLYCNILKSQNQDLADYL